ncbi:MAG: GNAT family N-acetyltransferase [Catenulispora sp.]|nr:GNAT family N-acetyltransferase [Catenulispora sp.]
MADLLIRAADHDDRVLLERLWLLFRHDMSEFSGSLPNPDGSYRSEWLVSALEDDNWAAYVAFAGDSPVGFAFVRALDQPVRVLNSFFIVRAARGDGYGTRLARHVLDAHPGPWEIAFQEANVKGARFWRRLAQEVAPGTWHEEERPASRPELPPNVWVVIP